MIRVLLKYNDDSRVKFDVTKMQKRLVSCPKVSNMLRPTTFHESFNNELHDSGF
jgi:hypothetical protein